MGKGHATSNCKYKDFQCRACGKKGHLERPCKNSTQQKRPEKNSFCFSKSRAVNKPVWERETKYISAEGINEGEIATWSRMKRTLNTSKDEWSADQLVRPPDSDSSEDLNQPAVEAEWQQSDMDKDCGLFALKGNCEYVKPYMVMIRCNGVKLKMGVDPAAAMSIISWTLYRKRSKKFKLQPCDVTLKAYSSEQTPLLGQFQVTVTCKEQSEKLVLLVSKGKGPSLMGRNWTGRE